MLQLKAIVKDYAAVAGTVHALRGVTLDFRKSEFVAILGQSGCGKTTLLNIIGGLDRYTAGDLVIDGRSTSEYTDTDWDSYRNHSIGFVFQSYNLIGHQSVLSNVEMALKLFGADASERRKKAIAALEQVGLGDQLDKKPSMMSGGQMQRVAIARALVNDPAVVLADEPTGALDSKTSVQIMDLLAEVAKSRLVIMVTHNPELAEQYASRIIRLKDGEVVADSNPPVAGELAADSATGKPLRSKLAFVTALGLSLSNLLTKKGRTVLTAFAGAIGIIGIALILALSTGMNDYINQLESDTMGSYPIELEKETIDLSSMMEQQGGPDTSSDDGTGAEGLTGDIISSNIVADSVKEAEEISKSNDLGSFRAYLLEYENELGGSLQAVEYGYDVTPQVYREDKKKGLVQVSPATLETGSSGSGSSGDAAMDMTSMMSGSLSAVWTQLADNEGLREATYTLQAGEWPDAADEVALVVDEDGRVSDYTLYTLGLMDIGRMNEIVDAAEAGEDYDDPQMAFSFDEVLGLEYEVLAQSDLYEQSTDDVWVDSSDDDDFVLSQMEDTGLTVKVVGVLSIADDAADSDVVSGIVYTSNLTSFLMEKAAESDVVQAQLADSETNVLTGEAFEDEDEDDGDGDGEEETGEDNEEESVATATTQTSAAFAADDTGMATTAAAYMDGGNVTTAVYRLTTAQATYGGAAVGVPLAVSGEAGNEVEESQSGLANAADTTAGAADEPAQATAYTVRFLNWDGAELSSDDYEQGATITAPAETPTRESDSTFSYSFVGWKSSVTNAVYTDVADIPVASEAVDYTAFYYAVQVGRSDAGSSATTSVPSGSDATTLPGYSDFSGTATGDTDGIDMSAYASQLSDGTFSSTNGLDVSALAGMSGGATSSLSDTQLQALMAQMSDDTPSTCEEVLAALGYTTVEEPSAISLYPVDFEGKSAIEDFIASYNDQVESEAQKVAYTDMIATMTSMLTSVVDIISYVLIAFTAISLVVSSIMIAIITWISVLERTKEIGVLRAIGASKGDVSKIFNAETVIEGLLSGAIGVGATLLLCVPINAVISSMFGAENIACLPAVYAVGLIALSVVLTFIAGFVPARMAARKDPVAALRSE